MSDGFETKSPSNSESSRSFFTESSAGSNSPILVKHRKQNQNKDPNQSSAKEDSNSEIVSMIEEFDEPKIQKERKKSPEKQKKENSKVAPVKAKKAKLTPEKTTKTPEKKAQALDKAKKAPEKKVRTPVKAKNTTEKNKKTPEEKAKMPEKPKLNTKKTKKMQEKVKQMPERAEQIPEVIIQIPENIEEIPEIDEQIPERVEQVPERVIQIPENAEQVPEKVDGSDLFEEEEEEIESRFHFILKQGKELDANSNMSSNNDMYEEDIIFNNELFEQLETNSNQSRNENEEELETNSAEQEEKEEEVKNAQLINGQDDQIDSYNTQSLYEQTQTEASGIEMNKSQYESSASSRSQLEILVKEIEEIKAANIRMMNENKMLKSKNEEICSLAKEISQLRSEREELMSANKHLKATNKELIIENQQLKYQTKDNETEKDDVKEIAKKLNEEEEIEKVNDNKFNEILDNEKKKKKKKSNKINLLFIALGNDLFLKGQSCIIFDLFLNEAKSAIMITQ